MPTITKTNTKSTLYSDVYRECDDLIKSFANYIFAPPIELLEDVLLTVNRWLRARYPNVRVEIDRYAPRFDEGALRITIGAYVAGMAMAWTSTRLVADGGDFVGRFGQDEVERLDAARDLLRFFLGFIASRVEL